MELNTYSSSFVGDKSKGLFRIVALASGAWVDQLVNATGVEPACAFLPGVFV